MEFQKVLHKVKINKRKMYGRQVTLNKEMNSQNSLNKLTQIKRQFFL